MKSLVQSNPHLADPQRRQAWLRQNALESSIFEGARGLRRQVGDCRKRRSIASTKKPAKGS